MKTVRWGIIGCGDVCEVKSGPAFYKVPQSELVAVMRRSEERVRDFAARHQVPLWYTDVDELLANPNVDIVYIATPPSTHAELTIRALQAGKAAYVEKPMALNTLEAKAMVDMAEETGKSLYVAHYRRALPYFIKVKELVDSGAIGTLLSVAITHLRAPLMTDYEVANHTWRVKPEVAGGGYLLDLAPHTIDILSFIAGDFDRVEGFTTNRAELYGAEDTVVAAFALKGGALGTATWSFVTSSLDARDEVVLVGTKGSIRFSVFDFTPVALETGKGTQLFTFEKPEHIQQPFIQTIVDDMLGRGVCPCKNGQGIVPNLFIDKLRRV